MLSELQPLLIYMREAKDMALALVGGNSRMDLRVPTKSELDSRFRSIRESLTNLKDLYIMSDSKDHGPDQQIEAKLQELNLQILNLKHENELRMTEYERCCRRITELKRIQMDPVDEGLDKEMKRLHAEYVRKHQNVQFLKYHNSQARKRCEARKSSLIGSQTSEDSHEEIIITGDLV